MYVTGLEGEFASETHLQQLFAPHGKVVSCKIYKDELERPKGDALVTVREGWLRQTSGGEGPRRDAGPLRVEGRTRDVPLRRCFERRTCLTARRGALGLGRRIGNGTT